MNTNASAEQMEREIEAIKKKLVKLGPMHPGSVSRQYQACGNPACRCMDPENPQKHGPYYKLAYVHRGKPVCRFVRAACVGKMKKQLVTYKTFRALVDRWIELSISRGVIDFFTPAPNTKTKKSH